MSTTKSDFIPYTNKKHEQFVSDDSGNFTASDGDGSHVTAALSPRLDPTTSTQSTGLTEEGCYTSGVSMTEYLTAPTTPNGSGKEPSESFLKAIFDNFNELYQDKMAWIDENISGGDNHAQAKKNVLEHWVKDVIEQNNILVQTVEDLELEAEKKVQSLQKKVHEAAELAKEHMGMIKEYEEQIRQLIKEKHIVEKQEEFFRKESMYLEKEKRRALDRLHTLENDNSSLVTLINRIRDMGVWDINGLNFSPRTYDCIFGLYPSLAGSEVQTVFTREKARNLEKAETNVAQLMAQVEELHDRKNDAEKLLTEKTKVTEELQNDIKELNSKIKQYQEEHQEIKQSLKETQDQLKSATLKNVSRASTADTKKESEMKEMLTELRDLRNQLNIACSERQQAMKESDSLKAELRGRIHQMEDMKCLLDQIQTEAATTRTVVQDVQDKQDQMSTLKEKVTFYQTSYENSNLLLEAKSEIIVQLQDQMEQLTSKVSKLEKSHSCSPKPTPNPSANCVTTTVSPSPTPTPSRHYSHPPSRPSSHQVRSQLREAISSGRKQKFKEALRKATVKVKKPSLTPKSSKAEQKYDSKRYSSSHKLPWNDNFIRSHRKLCSPRATTFEKLRTQVESKYETKTATISKVTHKSDSTSATRHEKSDEKRTFTEASKANNSESSHQPVNRIIADYLGQSDGSAKINSEKKTLKQRIVERVKFPPIPSNYEPTVTTVQPSTAKTYDKTLDEHLPRIVKEKKIHTSSGIEALENLMEVCVKASRELNRQADVEGQSAPKYRVSIGHSHRRHSHRRENTYTVEAIPKNKSSKIDSGLSKPVFVTRPEIKVYKEKATTKQQGDNKQLTESESETMSDISQFRRVALHPPPKSNPITSFPDNKSPESILAELPKENQDYLVKRWIISSPTPSKKIRKPRSNSPSKTTSQNITENSRTESLGIKSKTSGRPNFKILAMDEWNHKEETTHSDGMGDRDSGHMSDFSDGWNWNVNDDELNDKDNIQANNSTHPSSSQMESHQRVSLNHHHNDYDRIEQLIAENQRLQDEKMELQQMNSVLKREKSKSEAAHKKEIERKDIEDCPSSLSPFNFDDKLVHYNKNLTCTQRALSSYRDKVGFYSHEINSTKIKTDKLSQSNSLEKDILMYRSYVLLSQLEQDKELLMSGDCIPDYSPDDKMVECKESWERKIREIKEKTNSLETELAARVSDAEYLKSEGETIQIKIQELVSQATIFQEIMSVAQGENARLHSKIKELENKQKDMQEMLLMENEFNKLHDEPDSCDTSLLIAEKRLGIIQKSYESLAHQVLNREDAIVQRDLQIAKLQNYIREKEYNWKASSRPQSSLSVPYSDEITDSLMSGDCQLDKSVRNTEEPERVQKLIWLVTALRRKLKKRKDLDKKFQRDKEILVNTVSTMSFTWEELRRCCENLRKENLYLKKELETLSLCPLPQSFSLPCQITHSVEQEVFEANERRIALNLPLNSTSTLINFNIPILQPNIPVLQDKTDNFMNENTNVQDEVRTPKGLDIMSKVLVVLEECVANVSHLLNTE